LSKIDNRKQQRMAIANAKAAVAKAIKFNENLMIKSTNTNGHLVINVTDKYPNFQRSEQLQCTTSSVHTPAYAVARSVIQLEAVYPIDGDSSPRFGQKLFIKMIIAGISQPLYLTSKISSPNTYEVQSTNQTAFFGFEKCSDAFWYVSLTFGNLTMDAWSIRWSWNTK
jgi:hypothetical protein